MIRQTNQAIIWEDQVDVDEQRVNGGISGVFFAIRSGNKGCLEILRRFGANFDQECMSESNQLMKPVQYAVYRGNFEIYKFILDCNDYDLEGQYSCKLSQTGSTLLHLNAFKGNVEILKDLLQQNIDPFA